MSDTNDMRREFEAWLNSSKTANGYDSDLFQSWQAATERAAAQPDAKDAARYRWLRDQAWFSGSLCVLRDPKRVLTSAVVGLGADCPSGTRLDTAIDEAIRQGGDCMSDTNDMRREFEAWYSQTFDDQCVLDEARNCYVEIGCHLAWKGWQAATERATAVERERCAKVCEVTALDGIVSSEPNDLDIRQIVCGTVCAASIRQGGDK